MTDTPPLIERFVVMGIDTTKDSYSLNNAINGQIFPQFIEIYPFVQQTTSSYLDNFRLWCFPQGFNIYNEYMIPINNQRQQGQRYSETHSSNQAGGQQNFMSKNSVHHFVLTNSESDKKYCTALIFHEEIYLKIGDEQSHTIQIMRAFAPKAICLISNYVLFEFQRQFLSFLYKFTIASKLINQPSKIKVFKSLMQHFSSLCDQCGSFASAEKLWDKGEYQLALKSLMNNQSNSLQKQTNQYLPSNQESNAQYFFLKEEFLVHFLFQISFRAHSLLTPQFFFSNSEIVFELANEEVTRFSPSSHQTEKFFTVSNFSYGSLFEKISVKNILSLVNCILLERQIIIISSYPNEIISLCQSLLSLIYPLKWACIYIPLLPPDLVDMLSALMPYIVGMSKENFDLISHKIDFKDKVVVDLDLNIISQASLSNFTLELPIHLQTYLATQLEQLVGTFNHPNYSQKRKDEQIDGIFKLKRLFLNFMISLINNFTPYLLYSVEFNHKNVAARDVFSNQEYLDIFLPEEQQFMTEFSQNTMMFNKFLEESYRVLHVIEFQKKELDKNEDKDGIMFFLKINKKIQNALPKQANEKRFDIIKNQLMFSALDLELDQQLEQSKISYRNPKVIDLTGELIKYLKHLENNPLKKTDKIINTNSIQAFHQNQLKIIPKVLFEPLNKQWMINFSAPNQSSILVLGNYNKKVTQQEQNRNNKNSFNKNNMNSTLKQLNSFEDTEYDPSSMSENCEEPSITQSPIIFYRKVFLQYDSSEKRQSSQEFGMNKLKYPCLGLDFRKRNKLQMNPYSTNNFVAPVALQEQLNKMMEQFPKTLTTSNKQQISCKIPLLNKQFSSEYLNPSQSLSLNKSVPFIQKSYIVNQSTQQTGSTKLESQQKNNILAYVIPSFQYLKNEGEVQRAEKEQEFKTSIKKKETRPYLPIFREQESKGPYSKNEQYGIKKQIIGSPQENNQILLQTKSSGCENNQKIRILSEESEENQLKHLISKSLNYQKEQDFVHPIQNSNINNENQLLKDAGKNMQQYFIQTNQQYYKSKSNLQEEIPNRTAPIFAQKKQWASIFK